MGFHVSQSGSFGKSGTNCVSRVARLKTVSLTVSRCSLTLLLSQSSPLVDFNVTPKVLPMLRDFAVCIESFSHFATKKTPSFHHQEYPLLRNSIPAITLHVKNGMVRSVSFHYGNVHFLRMLFTAIALTVNVPVIEHQCTCLNR